MKTRIYIVDDELMAIKYFKYLLQNVKMESEIIGEATNGVKAIPEIIRLKPDIVFADISMPVMDGLRMAEEILKKNSAQKIILLTSYKDFDYVKKGMKIGVADYILKNELTEETLQTLLERVTQDILVKQKEQHLIMEHNTRSFLLSGSAPVEDHIYESRPMQRYVLISVFLRPQIQLKYVEKKNNFHVDCFEMEKMDFPDGLDCRATIEMAPGEYCGVFFIHEKVIDLENLCRKAAENLLDAFETYNSNFISIISCSTNHFLNLQEIYKQIKSSMDYCFAYQDEKIFYQYDLEKRIKNRKISEEKLEMFFQEMESNRLEAAKVELRQYLRNSRKQKSIWEYTEDVQNIYRYEREFAEKRKIAKEILEVDDIYYNPELVEDALERGIDMISFSLENQMEHQYSRYILLAMDYIQNHYSEEISIPEIADKIKVSEGHLRRCFKQELNCKVVDYLTEYRLERAKNLMKKREYTLDEIWQKTGFASLQYFSYVFKRKEGISPREYIRKTVG